MRHRIGLYNFSSQYQQRPIPISSNLIKREWLRFYSPEELPPRFLRIVQSWDTAAKTSELNDYSVCITSARSAQSLACWSARPHVRKASQWPRSVIL